MTVLESTVVWSKAIVDVLQRSKTVASISTEDPQKWWSHVVPFYRRSKHKAKKPNLLERIEVCDLTQHISSQFFSETRTDFMAFLSGLLALLMSGCSWLWACLMTVDLNFQRPLDTSVSYLIMKPFLSNKHKKNHTHTKKTKTTHQRKLAQCNTVE